MQMVNTYRMCPRETLREPEGSVGSRQTYCMFPEGHSPILVGGFTLFCGEF